MPYDPNWQPDPNSPGSGQIYRAAKDQGNQTGMDVSGFISNMSYGDNKLPGLMGGRYQVNPNAYWDINGNQMNARGGAANAIGQSYNDRALMQGQGDQTRMQQQGLIQMLTDQAMGRGPSLAQGQLQQATDRNIQQQAAMAASQRGAGAAGGAYQAANQAGMMNQQAANDASQLRMQEQLQARGMLGGMLSGTRGQDIGQQQLQFNEQQQNDQMRLQYAQIAQEYMKQGLSADQANREAAIKMEQLKNDAYKGSGGGGAGSFLGGMFSSMSDERVKKDVKGADDEISSFLDALEPHSYEYKKKKHGSGRRISVMAQELEKSKLGKEFVFETEDGKAVDYGKGLGTMLAAQAAIHKRLKKLEGK